MSQIPVYGPNGEFMGSTEYDPKCSHPQGEVKRDRAGDCHSGCCDGYRCQQCGRLFTVEVPD